MSDLFDDCPDNAYTICLKCGGDVGHLINCPDGSAFSGDRKTIEDNSLEAKMDEKIKEIEELYTKGDGTTHNQHISILLSRIKQLEEGINEVLDGTLPYLAEQKLKKLVEEKG